MLLLLAFIDAILCVGVRFHVVDVNGTLGSPQCKSDSRLTTNEKSLSYQDTISAVLGSRFLAGLCPIHIDLTSFIESTAQGVGRNITTDSIQPTHAPWRIEGLVSKAPSSSNLGEKVAREAQFFSLNGRPVDLPKISRVILDTWKIYDYLGSGIADDSMRKRPACVLGIYLPTYMIDVNVSPDKREVFIVDDENLHNTIKEALMQLWSGQREGVFKLNEAASFTKRRSSDDVADLDLSMRKKEKSGERTLLQQSIMQFRDSQTDSQNDEIKLLDPSNRNKLPDSGCKKSQNLIQSPSYVSASAQAPAFAQVEAFNPQIPVDQPTSKGEVIAGEMNGKIYLQRIGSQLRIKTGDHEAENDYAALITEHSFSGLSANEKPKPQDDENIPPPTAVVAPIDLADGETGKAYHLKSPYFSDSTERSGEAIKNYSQQMDQVQVTNETIFTFGGTKNVISQFSKARVRMKRLRRHLSSRHGKSPTTSSELNEFLGSSENDDETISLSKSDFENMTIIGQYNLGFILALCPSYHLWILDQVRTKTFFSHFMYTSSISVKPKTSFPPLYSTHVMNVKISKFFAPPLPFMNNLS